MNITELQQDNKLYKQTVELLNNLKFGDSDFEIRRIELIEFETGNKVIEIKCTHGFRLQMVKDSMELSSVTVDSGSLLVDIENPDIKGIERLNVHSREPEGDRNGE